MAEFSPHWDFTTVICHDKYSLQYVRSCLQRMDRGRVGKEALNQSFLLFFFYISSSTWNKWSRSRVRWVSVQDINRSGALSFRNTPKLPRHVRGSLPWTFKKIKLCFTRKTIPLLATWGGGGGKKQSLLQGGRGGGGSLGRNVNAQSEFEDFRKALRWGVVEKGRGSVTGKERPAENLLEAATGSRRYGSTIIESRVLHDQRALCFKSYFGSSLEKKKE